MFAFALLAAGTRAAGVTEPESLKVDASSPPHTSTSHFVDLITLDSSINPATADFISGAVAQAAGDNAAALVIKLDTPGGLLTSMQQIVKTLLNAPIPVIVYVAPAGATAASAGTFITVAANIAAMAPGTTIGAAHPVEMGGADIKGAMAKKVENFAASFAKSIAHQRGRNEAWVEQAVRESSMISEREALKLHVIDIVAASVPDLLRQASGHKVTLGGGRELTLKLVGAGIISRQMRLGERILNQLADPNVMYLLFLAGIAGIYFEFAHPGVFLPGVAGAICLVLALTSFQVLPINLSGLLLVLIGLAMLGAELFVTSYGILGLGGITAFVLGSLFLIDTSETNLAVNRGIIAGAAIGMSLIILGVGYIALQALRGPAQTGLEGLIGKIGEVREPIAPGVPGRVFVHGENWRAVSSETMDVGMRARVTAVKGLEIEVRRESAG
ncbi:MAG: NfeD family protein [Candidatus Binataceae bacterium]